MMQQTNISRSEEVSPHIVLLDEEFDMPQLGQKRKVWALLPHDYRTSGKRYPVLYLQDAQNLFDEQAPFGNWAIDKHMADLSEAGFGDLIIIGVDHGETERIKEYSPYYHRKFGKGKGKLYADFIIKNLKPYIDRELRTMPEREYAGIGGSSMGALISSYIGLVHAEHFGKLMIFSPSFWYSDEIYFDAFNYAYTHHSKVYLYGGEKESKYMTKHIHKFRDTIDLQDPKNLFNEWKIVINPQGKHREYDWGQEFPRAVKWLFFNQ